MAYTFNSQLSNAAHQRERDMLLAGFSYTEVAQATGGRVKSISERNRIVYRVNIQQAFALRVERDGIPVRLNVDSAFGYWFSGFFDGEGCLTVFSRLRENGYTERRLGIQIMLRDDDANVLTRVKDYLQVGTIWSSPSNSRTNPAIGYRVEKIQDLAEVVIPLFDKYPLYSKKRREFAIWQEMVRKQYIATLGGYSQRTSASDEYNAAFDKAMQAIRDIRTYTAPLVE